MHILVGPALKFHSYLMYYIYNSCSANIILKIKVKKTDRSLVNNTQDFWSILI